MSRFAFKLSIFPSFLFFFRKRVILSFFPSFLLSIIAVFLLFLPFLASAQVRDPGCVTDIRKTGDPTICLAVPFGNVKEVANISEYIGKFYDFSIGAILSLAIFMIVIGGVQWVFAVGNPGKISKAKSTIGSAFWGVVLAFISVGMLRIINPDLISLKLPKVETIEQNQFFGNQECRNLPDGTKVDVGGGYGTITIDRSSSDYFYLIKNFECNQTFPIVGSNTQCRGHECVDDGGNEGLCTSTGCIYGNLIGGTISWDDNYYVDEIQLVAVCNDNVVVNMGGGDASRGGYYLDTTEQSRWYTLPINQADLLGHSRQVGNYGTSSYIDYYCGGGDHKPKGYLLGVSVNDASSLWPTIDDDFVLDRSCKRAVINQNTQKYADYQGGALIPSDTQLISYNELTTVPFECNIQISKNSQSGVGARGNITYQVGIQRHWTHASRTLQDVLNRIAAKQSIVIKSISDNNFFDDVNKDNVLPDCQPWGGGPFSVGEGATGCHHKKGSAHYGGTVLRGQPVTGGVGKAPANAGDVSAGGFSCAADIGPVASDTYQTLKQTIDLVASENAAISIRPICERKDGSVDPGCSDPSIDHIHVGVSTPGDTCFSDSGGTIAY